MKSDQSKLAKPLGFQGDQGLANCLCGAAEFRHAVSSLYHLYHLMSVVCVCVCIFVPRLRGVEDISVRCEDLVAKPNKDKSVYSTPTD